MRQNKVKPETEGQDVASQAKIWQASCKQKGKNLWSGGNCHKRRKQSDYVRDSDNNFLQQIAELASPLASIARLCDTSSFIFIFCLLSEMCAANLKKHHCFFSHVLRSYWSSFPFIKYPLSYPHMPSNQYLLSHLVLPFPFSIPCSFRSYKNSTTV